MSYWAKALATTVAVNVAAVTIPAVLRAVGIFGHPSDNVETGLGLVFILGVINLFWVIPVFAVAAAVGRAAALRRRPTGLLIATVFLGGVPLVGFGPLLVADWPEMVAYVALLYGAGWHRLRHLALADENRRQRSDAR